MSGYAVWEGRAATSSRYDATMYAGLQGRQTLEDSGKGDTRADTESIRQLLAQLLDAEKTSKNQTVQDLRDKLDKKREELGDEKFKEIMKALMEQADSSWMEFLRRLMKSLFPEMDDETPTPPAPPMQRGGGGGGRPVNPSDFGPSQPMNTKPFTEGANHYNYKPDLSNPGKKPGTGNEPGNIWSGFKQGEDGNCVTVSSIKAAMMRFGQKPTDVFKDVKESGDGYDVTMRDGFKLHVSKDEVKQAAENARFQGDDPAMMTDANFMYAASAKRAQMEGNAGGWDENDHNARRSFTDALKSLNDGEHSREGLDRLGLKNHHMPGFEADLRNGAVGTWEYGGHSMAVITNRLELWGQRGNNTAHSQGIITVLT
ncbi:hypothetical protein [Pseudomonas sp. MPB26]|uniref:hypothetical protein n=1 Tax=Pseudomonas sp. MPB26 TaxID=3388491 RepID=UPI003984FC7E